jgi:hypothetical protein
MLKSLKTIIRSRYVHLSLGLLVLYGVSWVLTSTTRFEKILDSLSHYCYADYMVIGMKSKEGVDRGSCYRDRYEERLDRLTAGLFDWNNEDQAREFFMNKGYVYEVTEEGKRYRSYLLAPVIDKGIHTTEVPQHVTFYYYFLDYKEVPTFLEYLDKKNTSCLFVSAAKKVIYAHPEVYIHMDSLAPLLRECFETLWEGQFIRPEDFQMIDDSLICCDLKDLCEEVFIKRIYRNKETAKKYFVKEGFNVFWPALLAMGARMAADQDLELSSGYRYLRAVFTGLSHEPNFTMSYLSLQYHHYDPAINRIMEEFKRRYGGNDPGGMTLQQISQAAQEMLKKLESS